MLEPHDIKEAAEQAALGVGYPHAVVSMARCSDDRGWVVSFNDISEPQRGAVLAVQIHDGATQDEAAQAFLEHMSRYATRGDSR